MHLFASDRCYSFVPLQLCLDEVQPLVERRDRLFAKPSRAEVEEKGRKLLTSNLWTAAAVGDFATSVFRWSMNVRNLDRVLKATSLTERLRRSSELISENPRNGKTVAKAVWALADAVPNLGPSYSSKLLRFLYPDSVVIFDSIVRTGLGLEDSERGYHRFFDACAAIQTAMQAEGKEITLSDVEAAVFMKLRKAQG